jgi:hypothetical protein
VRFQAIQAVAFDAVFIVILMIGFGCFFVMLFGGTLLGTVGIGAAASSDDPSGAALGAFSGLFFIIPFAAQCVMFAVMGVFFVGRLIAAVNAFQGRNFRYPILGERLEKMLAA